MRIGNTYFKIYELVLAALSFLTLAALTIWLLIRWNSIPDIIPTHFGVSGEADATGGKGNIWILPGLGWIIWITFTVLDFFPGAWNVRGLGEIRSEAGKAKALSMTRTFLEVIKLLIVLLFAYLTVNQVNGTGPSALFLPLVIFLLMGTSVVHIVLLSRLK